MMSVSVIIPLHNGKRFIRTAIESVLNQTILPDEIIVVDDGSNDGGANLVPSHERIRLISQANSGVAAARNRGIRESNGTLLAFLDQDDSWTSDKLEVQTRTLAADPGLGFVLAHQLITLAPGVEKPGWLKTEQLGRPCPGYLPGTFLVRRSILDHVGPFDENFKSGSDSEWFFRAKDMGIAMRILPEVLLHRTIHRENQSHDTATANRELLLMIRNSLKKQKDRS